MAAKPDEISTTPAPTTTEKPLCPLKTKEIVQNYKPVENLKQPDLINEEAKLNGRDLLSYYKTIVIVQEISTSHEMPSHSMKTYKNMNTTTQQLSAPEIELPQKHYNPTSKAEATHS